MPKAEKTPEVEDVQELDLRKYEIMLIIDPDVTQTQYKKHVEDIKTLLTSHGASIWNEEEWGKRELAYTIKKKRHGYYVVFNFDGDPAQLKPVNDQLRITPYVLRHLMIKVPANYTPQEYDWDAEIEDTKPEPKAKPAPKRAAKPAPKVEDVREIPQEAPAAEKASDSEETAEAAPEAAETPKEEAAPETDKKAPEPSSTKKLEKLDEKLEKLLSGDDDLNL